MIENESTAELFRFFVRDLISHGYQVETGDAALAGMVTSVVVNPYDGVGTMICRLDFTITEFEVALEDLGTGAEFMWPGSGRASSGLRLLLTHLDEQRLTRSELAEGPVSLSWRDGEMRLEAS